MKSSEGAGVLTDKFIPDGYTSIVLNFTGKFYVFTDGDFRLLPHAFLITPLFYALNIRVNSPADTMVVLFHTTVFSNVFNLNLFKLGKSPYKPASNIINEKIWMELKIASSEQERIGLFEAYLSEITNSDNYIPDRIDLLYRKIYKNCGKNRPLQKLVEEVGLNERTFRRQFLNRTGMNAKNLNRVVRINSLWTLFVNHHISDFQSMIFEANYYDQAHMIKDFKMFIGESPKKFFSRDQEILKFMSGKFSDNELLMY